MKANVFLRKKGLNYDFKLKGSNFKGTLLDLLNEYDSIKQVKNLTIPVVIGSLSKKKLDNKKNEDRAWLIDEETVDV